MPAVEARMTDIARVLPTIVVADGDNDARSRNASYLRSWGFHVIEVETSAQCLAILESGANAGVLLARVALGELNGFELALLVRKQWPEVKVFLATNDAMAAHRSRALCDQYIWTKL
jgi:CheY-like chemotaxis protein